MDISCRRGKWKTNSVEADDIVSIQRMTNSMDRRAPNNYPNVHSSLCTKSLDSASDNSLIHLEMKCRQRRRQTSYIFHICTLMVLLTCADALHHAAFVSQIGRGSSLQTISAYRGKLWSSPHTSSRGSGVNKISIQVKSIRHLLQMAQSSDTEVQTDAAQSKVDDDEEEWRTLLAAFKMYKAAYGDLKVPSRFVVPGMAPWPGENNLCAS